MVVEVFLGFSFGFTSFLGFSKFFMVFPRFSLGFLGIHLRPAFFRQGQG